MTKKIIAVALCLTMLVTFCACNADPTDKPSTPSSNQTEGTASNTTEPTQPPTTQPPTTTTTVPTTQKLAMDISCADSLKRIIGLSTVSTMQASFNKEGYTKEQVKWSTSDANVLAVDASGKITAMSVGSATISATIVGVESATDSVTYQVQKLVTSAEFLTKTIEVKAGFSAPIGAKALPEDATDTLIHWGNSNPNVAAIKETNVIGYGAGTAIFTAYNNRNEALGDVVVTVLPGPIEGADGDFGNQIVEFSSPYDASNANRTTNLIISSGMISGRVFAPGQLFSFNGLVGERTRAKGYKNATIFNGAKEEQGLAGGICQVSSTIFNAALLFNAQIVERHQHSLKIPYVKLGQDAAIMWGSQDMKFINTLTVPIKIHITIGGGTMTVRIFTPGEASYALPKIVVESGGSGNDYWMRRTVDGVVNYSANTSYLTKK